MSGREKRAGNRVDVAWKARVGRKGMGVCHALVRNVSLGGLYMECAQRFDTGSSLLMEVAAWHGGEVRRLLIEGTVLRVDTGLAERTAYGVRFHRIRDEDLHYLLAVIAELWVLAEGGNR